MGAIRKWLLAGLLVIVPVAITIWVLDWIVSTLDKTLLILPVEWRPDRILGFHVPGFGVLLALAVLLVVGALASNFLGRKLVDWSDLLLHRIPGVRSIYSGVKQVSDTLFSENGNAFRTAVLLQWPREGVWTIGFVTGTPGGDAATYLPDDCLSVYVPTTPNPTIPSSDAAIRTLRSPLAAESSTCSHVVNVQRGAPGLSSASEMRLSRSARSAERK